MLVAAFWLVGRHLRYRFTLFSCVGMDNLNQWIDDRQSFERARHPQKKNPVGEMPSDLSIPYIDLLLGPPKAARDQANNMVKQKESHTLEESQTQATNFLLRKRW